MSKKWKMVSLVVASYLILVLLFTAVYDRIFYFTQEIRADSSVYIVGDEYQYYFYINDDNKAITLAFDIQKVNEDLAHITLDITPKDNHKISSLLLGFENIIPSEAFLLDDPSGVYSNPYSCAINYSDSVVTISYSDLSTRTDEVVELEYWIDITKLNSVDEKFTMSFSMYMFEDSLFKIWRYQAQSAVELDIND